MIHTLFKKFTKLTFYLFIVCLPILCYAKPLDTTKTDWFLIRNKTHETPRFNDKLSYKLEDYGAYGVGDTSRKVIYLTFDEGYENGYTSQILDALKKQDVKATFFVTLPYIKANNDLIKRMADEGHDVGNHTDHHLSMPSLVNQDSKFTSELTAVAEAYTEVTHKQIAPFFRPPMGHYSEKSLAMTQALGYKTLFWSFAYCDWKPDAQPNPEKAKALMLEGLHNGAIYLLHAVSKTNTQILEDFIQDARAQGYTFEKFPTD